MMCETLKPHLCNFKTAPAAAVGGANVSGVIVVVSLFTPLRGLTPMGAILTVPKPNCCRPTFATFCRAGSRFAPALALVLVVKSSPRLCSQWMLSMGTILTIPKSNYCRPIFTTFCRAGSKFAPALALVLVVKSSPRLCIQWVL